MALATVAVLVVLGSLQLAAPGSSAAGVGQYSAPIWWPLRGDNLIGCAYKSVDFTIDQVCNGQHHSYWAIDLQATLNQPIYPSGAGFATVSSDDTSCTGYGRSVTVDHNGSKSLYAHMDHFSAALTASPGGVWVDRDTVIGYVGHTGSVTGCTYNHLHYEESTSGAFGQWSTDPGPFMACKGTVLKTYPRAMGETSWEGFIAHKWTAHTDGGTCVPPGTDPRPDGTFVQTQDGTPFQVVGGSLLASTGTALISGGALLEVLPIVDPADYLPYPHDATAIEGYPSGAKYVFAGGAAIPISDWAAIGNPPPRQVLDSALTSSSSFSSGHVRPTPANGTILLGLPSLGYWKIVNGARSPVPASASAVAVNDSSILSFLRFWDVPPSAPFAADIAWLTQTGITTGNPDGSFGSNDPVSRQAMAAFLYRYAGSPNGPKPLCSVAPKTDVPKDSMFCGEITWLVGQGITTGYPDGSFHPAESISREAMAAFMYRFAKKPNGDHPTCETAPKTDIPVGRAFCGEIAWMVTAGISTGYPDNTFRPNLLVQRQAMAAFLHRLSTTVPLG